MDVTELNELRGMAEMLAVVADAAQGVISPQRARVEFETLAALHGWQVRA